MFARLSAIVLSMLVTAMATARADQPYAVDGSDTYRVPGTTVSSEVAYVGVGRLHSERVGNATRFETSVSYRRTVDGATTRVTGSYQTTIAADGTANDGPDDDPDDLTILKQPFSVELDHRTLRDLGALTRAIPFDFPSPLIGGTLHGALHRLPDGRLQGQRVLGIAFSAQGPLHGSLPERPGTAVSGTISMQGRAYYAYQSALLLGLDATLAIAGTVDGSTNRQPVRIVYRRSIRPLVASTQPPH